MIAGGKMNMDLCHHSSWFVLKKGPGCIDRGQSSQGDEKKGRRWPSASDTRA